MNDLLAMPVPTTISKNNHQVLIDDYRKMLDSPDLTPEQRLQVLGKIASLTNAKARYEANKRAHQSKIKPTSDGPTARFSCVAQVWPDDWTQAQINAAANPIGRELGRIASGGIRTYPSHYQAVR